MLLDSNTTFVKVKWFMGRWSKDTKKIQIQHLLKLNIMIVFRYFNYINSNTTFVKVKLHTYNI